ncbi:MAG: hypothetical protein OEZ22_03510 [Spirochaetia bacterium]|nr:hypothetical protein [Spirochaetia bacterium]
MKINVVFRRKEILNILIVVSVFLNIHCTKVENDTEDTRDVNISAIQPKDIFFKNTERINQLNPFPGQTISSKSTFTFEASSVTYGALLIFNKLPSAENLEKGIIDESCIAGVSNIASHDWDGRTVQLSNLYKCLPDNTLEILSKTEKVYLEGGSYYWIVLGYDDSFALTHSSPALLFNYQ